MNMDALLHMISVFSAFCSVLPVPSKGCKGHLFAKQVLGGWTRLPFPARHGFPLDRVPQQEVRRGQHELLVFGPFFSHVLSPLFST